MGAFSEQLGIRPWEWDNLTAAEVLDLIRYVEESNKERQ